MICLKIKNLKLKIALAIVVLFLFFANTAVVKAQEISLSIWPPLLEVQMIPGKTVIQKYQLANNTDTLLMITPSIYPFETDGENGKIRILPLPAYKTDPSPYFFSLINLEMNQPFELKPKETKQISLKITLPKNTPEKDYYFTLLFSTASSFEGSKNQSGSVSKIGANILLTSSRIEKPAVSGKISNFSAPKIIDSFSPVNFSVVIENIGNTYFKPFGKIKIIGFLKQKGELELLPQNILVSTKRNIFVPQYRPNLPIGPFKARLEFSLNEEVFPPALSSEIVFWYFPWKLLSGIITALVIFLVIKNKNRQKKALT